MTGRAFWLSNDKTLDRWTRNYFPHVKEKRRLTTVFGEQSQPYWVENAPAFPLAPPIIDAVNDFEDSGIRKIRFQVRSQRQAPEIRVFVEGADVLSAKVENKSLFPATASSWRFRGLGFSAQNLHFELTVNTGRPFTIRAIDYSYELPPTALPSRPPDMMIQPFGMSDTTAVVNAVSLQ